MVEGVAIPRAIIEELRRRGLNPEDAVLDALAKAMNLDPSIVVEARIELAVEYLNEGKDLIDKDLVQASEELYKAVEAISERLGKWFRQNWDTANYLHVRGSHEAKLGPEIVKVRLPYIEKAVNEAIRVVGFKP